MQFKVLDIFIQNLCCGMYPFVGVPLLEGFIGYTPLKARCGDGRIWTYV